MNLLFHAPLLGDRSCFCCRGRFTGFEAESFNALCGGVKEEGEEVGNDEAIYWTFHLGKKRNW